MHKVHSCYALRLRAYLDPVFKASILLFTLSLCFDLHTKVEAEENVNKDVNKGGVQTTTTAYDFNAKLGKLHSLANSTFAWGIEALKNEQPPVFAIDNMQQRQLAFQGQLGPPQSSWRPPNPFQSRFQQNTTPEYPDLNNFDTMTASRRLVDDLLDIDYYEPNVHPSIDFRRPIRVNLSMSLYQILQVDERSQSICVNVWMVQDWYDQFLDWNPMDYEMINKTILPYNEVWTPDTYLYNSESLEQRRTESLQSVIITSGHWRNDTRGAYVQLMFPAIYKLSCKMNVRFFPYDQQNCTFIISSWTHDSATIDYYPKIDYVNMKNFAQNVEWAVISFDFVRIEQDFKCCPKPWVMLYAHLVIRRKPLYYIINLVVPTSIICFVAVTGFFTPSSTASERDEKLYLGINTLLTLAIMLLMIANKMPNTSSYIPLMGWYYFGIIWVIVIGTLLATLVLFIHSRKSRIKPMPRVICNFVTHRFVWAIILEPPIELVEIWTEYGILSETRLPGSNIDPLIIEEMGIGPSAKAGNPLALFSSISSQLSANSAYNYERKLASVTKKYTEQARMRQRRERKRRETLQNAADFLTYGRDDNNNSRINKRKKMMRRCALEWEFLANVIDRVLLFIFSLVTIMFFILLGFFDTIIDV